MSVQHCIYIAHKTAIVIAATNANGEDARPAPDVAVEFDDEEDEVEEELSLDPDSVEDDEDEVLLATEYVLVPSVASVHPRMSPLESSALMRMSFFRLLETDDMSISVSKPVRAVSSAVRWVQVAEVDFAVKTWYFLTSVAPFQDT